MTDTSRDPALLEPQLQRLWAWAEREWARRNPAGPRVFLTATHRGPVDQAKAYSEGKSRARFGESLHNFRPAFAFDVAFLKPDGSLDWNLETFRRFADLLKPHGLEWGGDWAMRDGPHHQLPMTIADAADNRPPHLPSVVANPPTTERLLVVEDANGDRHIHPIPNGHDVLLRAAIDRERVYVTIRPE